MRTTNLIGYHWIVMNKVFVEAQMHEKLWIRSKDHGGELQLKMIRRDRTDSAIERYKNENSTQV